jgi:hypothetical protein
MSLDFSKPIKSDPISDQLSLNSLLSVSCGQLVTNSTPTLVLKAINNIKQQIMTTSDQLFCLVFIYYLSQGMKYLKNFSINSKLFERQNRFNNFNPIPTGISSIVQLLEEQLSRNNRTIEEQKTFTIYLQLLLLHIHRNNGVSLKQLRSVLDRALDSYPTNEDFLSLFVNLEFKSNIFCRMRRFFAKTVNSFTSKSFDNNWNLIIYAIHSELRRLNRNGMF